MGMFALALVLSALFGFAAYIVKSLDMRRTLRAEAGRRAMSSSGSPGMLVTASDQKTVRVESFSAEYTFGKTEMSVREKVALPPMSGGL